MQSRRDATRRKYVETMRAWHDAMVMTRIPIGVLCYCLTNSVGYS
jgi:hypothetical protein